MTSTSSSDDVTEEEKGGRHILKLLIHKETDCSFDKLEEEIIDKDEPKKFYFQLIDAGRYLKNAHVGHLQLTQCTFQADFLTFFLETFKKLQTKCKKITVEKCWFPGGSEAVDKFLNAMNAEQWNIDDNLLNEEEDEFWRHDVIRKSSCLRIRYPSSVQDHQLVRTSARILILNDSPCVTSSSVNLILKAFINDVRGIQYISISGASFSPSKVMDGIVHTKLRPRKFIVSNSKGHEKVVRVKKNSFICYNNSKKL